MKKRKNKDDTEQPIYPCEECTQCFTTLSDLKVCISYLTCHSLISFIYRCIQEHIQKLHVIYVRFVIKVLLVQVLCVDTWRWVKPFCFISILYLKDKKRYHLVRFRFYVMTWCFFSNCYCCLLKVWHRCRICGCTSVLGERILEALFFLLKKGSKIGIKI